MNELDTSVRAEEALLAKRLELLQQMNVVGAELLGIGQSDEIEPDVSKSETISATLRRLRDLAEEHDQMTLTPSTLVERDSKELLLERADELQSELLAKQRTLQNRQSLKAVTPEINTIVEILQTRVAEMEQELPTNQEDQQASLEEIQDSKHQLEELVSRIPEDLTEPQALELRSQSAGYLTRLAELIRRLDEAVGEKAAALAAYLTFKKDVESQLHDVESKLVTVPATDASEGQLLRRIDELTQQEARLTQLQPQVIQRLENPHLGEKEKDEARALTKSIEQASNALKELRHQLGEELERTQKLDEERRQADRIIDELTKLSVDAQRTLTDAAAIPQVYELVGKSLEAEASKAEPLTTSGTLPDETRRDLVNILERCRELSVDLDRRWQLWQEFVARRDEANALLEGVRAPLDAIMTKGLRPHAESQGDVKKLEVGLSA